MRWQNGMEGKKIVNRMSSLQQISHWNCRRYWEMSSVSQEHPINTHCCQRNTWEAGTWCYFFIIVATSVLISSEKKLWVLSIWALISYFLLLWRRIMFKLFLYTSLQIFMCPQVVWELLSSPHSKMLLKHKLRWFSCSYPMIYITAVRQLIIKNYGDNYAVDELIFEQ